MSNYTPKMDKNILYSGPYYDSNEIDYAFHILMNGKWLVDGEEVRKFEKEFSAMFHSYYSLMVNSGSSANLVSILALKKRYKLGPNDKILVSSVGFPTTFAPMMLANLGIEFVDIEWETLNFNLNQIEKKCKNNKNIKAIFISPALGNPPNFDRLLEISKNYDVMLLLDGCDSLGSTWDSKDLNYYTLFTTCSFYPAHHITCFGGGGMVSSDDINFMNIAKSIAGWGASCVCSGEDRKLSTGKCGKRFSKWLKNVDAVLDHKYIYNNIGLNVKPLEIQGAVGRIQLGKFPEIKQKRMENYFSMIDIFLNKFENDLKIVEIHRKAEPCFFAVPLICNNKEFKEKLVAHLEKSGLQTRNYFAGNILAHPAYENLGDYKEFPNANRVLTHVFFVGAAPHYTAETFERIQKILKDF
jgi:CDP-6-deoxy-D-xylo-4-hexulose-3-dehydrase